MSYLEQAIRIATFAHEGQVDKGNNTYILHPLRVMLKMTNDKERTVAILHDVIEDSEVTLDDLLMEGFELNIRKAIYALTRLSDESYMDFIRRCKQNELARKVKVADIEDNMDLSRIHNPSTKDIERVKKYRKALKELLSDESLA